MGARKKFLPQSGSIYLPRKRLGWGIVFGRVQVPSKKSQGFGATHTLPAQASLPTGRRAPQTQRFPIPLSPMGSQAGLSRDEGCNGQVTKFCQTQTTTDISTDAISASSHAPKNPGDQIRTWRPHPGANPRDSTRQPEQGASRTQGAPPPHNTPPSPTCACSCRAARGGTRRSRGARTPQRPLGWRWEQGLQGTSQT